EDGNTLIADAAYITESMMDPNAKIRRGYPALMPSYQGLLTAAEVGALVEYIRELGRERRDLRASPLVPPTAPSVELPTQSPRELIPVVPGPLVGETMPRTDAPPYGPPSTEADGAPRTDGAPADGAPANGAPANGAPPTSNGARPRSNDSPSESDGGPGSEGSEKTTP